MRRFFFAVVFVLVTLTAMAGNPVAQGDSIQNLSNKFLERFNRFIKVRDTLFAKSVLSDWSEEIPNDPELYVAWFSYYYNASSCFLISSSVNRIFSSFAGTPPMIL